MSFINLDVSLLTDKWYGETQKLAAAVFSLAVKLQPCIVFIGKKTKTILLNVPFYEIGQQTSRRITCGKQSSPPMDTRNSRGLIIYVRCWVLDVTDSRIENLGNWREKEIDNFIKKHESSFNSF